MDEKLFQEELTQRINRYDLLKHSFYKAWTCGELTRLDLLDYAQNYYHQVASYPVCLDTLLERLPAGSTRATLHENKQDEEGGAYSGGRPHSDLWLDFVEGMGGRRDFVKRHKPLTEINELIHKFMHTSKCGSVVEALSMLYAYESQVPKISQEKAAGLKERYDADDKTCVYFEAHTEEDVHHSASLLEEIKRNIGDCAERYEQALEGAERAAKWLWQALDGVERVRRANLLLPCGAD